jgi:hypothetical protein
MVLWSRPIHPVLLARRRKKRSLLNERTSKKKIVVSEDGEEWEPMPTSGEASGRGAFVNGGNVPVGVDPLPAAAADMGPNNSSNNNFNA